MVGNGAKIESYEWNNGTGIFYDSYNYLLSELQKEAKLKMWDDNVFNSRVKFLPPGGKITFRIIRPTIGSASTDNFTVIIMQNGKELQRKTGKTNLPKPSSLTNNWISYFTIPIKTNIIHPFDVYIIDDLREKRYYFKITPFIH